MALLCKGLTNFWSKVFPVVRREAAGLAVGGTQEARNEVEGRQFVRFFARRIICSARSCAVRKSSRLK